MKNFIVLTIGLLFVFVFAATFLDNGISVAIEKISDLQEANASRSQK